MYENSRIALYGVLASFKLALSMLILILCMLLFFKLQQIKYLNSDRFLENNLEPGTRE